MSTISSIEKLSIFSGLGLIKDFECREAAGGAALTYSYEDQFDELISQHLTECQDIDSLDDQVQDELLDNIERRLLQSDSEIRKVVSEFYDGILAGPHYEDGEVNMVAFNMRDVDFEIYFGSNSSALVRCILIQRVVDKYLQDPAFIKFSDKIRRGYISYHMCVLAYPKLGTPELRISASIGPDELRASNFGSLNYGSPPSSPRYLETRSL